ncbi:MAG: galactokinase [Bacteroidota bacterium]
MLEGKVKDVFQTVYHSQPEVLVKAPGRINIMGEHTDYNLGFVLPAAIDYHIFLGLKKNDHNTFRIYSIDYDEQVEIKPDELVRDDSTWLNLIKGIIFQLNDQITGFDLAFCGNIPSGAGLSSSAALCCGTAFALSHLFDLKMSKWDLAKIAQKSEHTFALVQCGIMDQFASLFGMEDHVLILDCLNHEYEASKIDISGYELILIDSNVKHSLNDSEYNARRDESNEALNRLSEINSSIRNFRDVDPELLQSLKTDEVWWKRAQHIVSENLRVQAVSKALNAHQMEEFGRLLKEGHDSERYHYEITCTETDFLVDTLLKHDEIQGVRQVGGGFGGCILGIAKAGSTEQVIPKINRQYEEVFNNTVRQIPVKISKGCHLSNA